MVLNKQVVKLWTGMFCISAVNGTKYSGSIKHGVADRGQCSNPDRVLT
jgi:hypothetical protein